MAAEFESYALAVDDDVYASLCSSTRWQDVGKGRQGGVLVDVDDARGIPIVRTTTPYSVPPQQFAPVHSQLARQIEEIVSVPTQFNNALIEKYTNQYAKMGMHCDQALDLSDDSTIAIFSCYEHPEMVTEPRKLVIEAKDPDGSAFEVQLLHNSVVVFTLDTNRRFRHKIVLDRSTQPPENTWLGVTFRTSKTFVSIGAGRARFEDGTPLTLANGKQRHRFFSLRSRENKETDFAYPRLTFTISESDLMEIDV